MHGAEALTDAIVRAAAEGSAEDARRIVVAMEQQVRTMTTVRLTPSPAEHHAVDDIVQQVLASIVQGLPALRQPTVAGLRSFASAIVSHKVTDFLRAHGGVAHRSLDSTLHDESAAAALKDLLPASGLSPHSTLARKESIRLVMQELGRLSEPQREVITLAFFDQLPMSEIAERLGTSRPAASMQLIRAMQELRRAVMGSSKLHDGHARHV